VTPTYAAAALNSQDDVRFSVPVHVRNSQGVATDANARIGDRGLESAVTVSQQDTERPG
jgi:hypothetical protein